MRKLVRDIREIQYRVVCVACNAAIGVKENHCPKCGSINLRAVPIVPDLRKTFIADDRQAHPQ